jgi:hypothetical protein
VHAGNVPLGFVDEQFVGVAKSGSLMEYIGHAKRYRSRKDAAR